MESHEVLREASEKVGVKALAAHLRLSPALVYKWCVASDADDPDASGTRNPLDRLRDLVQYTGHIGVVGWLCQQANGFFVHNPEAKSLDIDSDLLLLNLFFFCGKARRVEHGGRPFSQLR